VTSPFSLDVKSAATLQSPQGATLHATFIVVPGDGGELQPSPFSLRSGEAVDLGKWRVIAGEDANVATATGSTEPPLADTEITVQFVATPSFF
jgi:hypothetical protein